MAERILYLTEDLDVRPSNARVSACNVTTIVFITLVQFVWLAATLGAKLALVNLLPATVLIAAWTLFISHCYANKPLIRNLLLLPLFILSLRLPVTVAIFLQSVNWLMALVMGWTICRHIFGLFQGRAQKRILLITVLILGFNASTHLGLNSPYTYTFRMMNGLPSAYSGVDNNATWECAYERPQFPVHCDARHFVASEKVFTEPDFDPGYSVVLQRFLHGYINSLAGLEGTRWWVNLGVNFLFWFFACACIYRICMLLKQGTQVAGLAMLCCASGIGFIDMFAQPAPYLLAYAYGPIVIWATLELIYTKLDRWRITLFLILIASALMVYDAFQLILVSVLLLFLHRKKMMGVLVFLLSVIFLLTWREFSMKLVLETQGDLTSPSSAVSILALNANHWMGVLGGFKVAELYQLTSFGARAYVYGNLIIGALAAWIYIFTAGRTVPATPEQRTFQMVLILLNALIVLSMIFVVPHMMYFSAMTGMMPRLAFYSYPVNMIALMLLATAWFKNNAWIVPLLLFIIANLNLTGLASIDMFFDYGRVGIFWK